MQVKRETLYQWVKEHLQPGDNLELIWNAFDDSVVLFNPRSSKFFSLSPDSAEEAECSQ